MNPTPHDDQQRRSWERFFAAEEYVYGREPGPVARRAVTYHRRLRPGGGTALDIGCGEGQDLAFLVAQGYDATGLEVTMHGAAKARRLLAERELTATVIEADLAAYHLNQVYDLVLAVNVLQFLGDAASVSLNRTIDAVAPGGVLGLSLFAPDRADSPFFTIALPDLLARLSPDAGHGTWHMLEAAQLWQWHPRTLHTPSTDHPQAFVTLIAQRVAD